MLDKRNPLALAQAGRRAITKTKKAILLGITPEMTDEELNAGIVVLAKAKAVKDGITDWKTLVSGQRWYVEDLKHFSKLSAAERLETEYQNAFPDSASEDELEAELTALMNKAATPAA